jgi:Zn-dependent peptidase ImmA (M78 family)/DNA-binding XRE family transcriptional regulator
MPTDHIGDRLRDLRVRSGLSQAGAADAVGVNRVLIAYYESGRRPVPLTTAADLAQLYGTDLEALARPPDDLTSGVADVLFRASPIELGERSAAGVRLYQRGVTAFADLADDLGLTLPRLRPSPFGEPASQGRESAAAAARRLREHLGQRDGPLDDPFRVADDHVLVWRLPLGPDLSDSPSGFFHRHPRLGPCVVVNTDVTLGRQVFTLAHELAHAFFHSQSTDVIVSTPARRGATRERFADAFAGELLVPGDALRAAIDELPGWDDPSDPVTAVRLQRHFGVSFATLLVRLRQEGVIDAETHERLGGVSPTRLALALGYAVHPADRGDFDVHPLERVPRTMLSLVRRGIEGGELTLGDAAETLGCSTEDVRPLTGRPAADERERNAHRDLADVARAG